MEIKLGIWFVYCKLGKGFDRDVLPFPELIAVAVEDNEQVFFKAQLATAFFFVQGVELPLRYTMRNDGNGLGNTATHKFVRTKFGVGNDGVPVVGGIRQATNPAIRIHGCITHKFKLALLVQVPDLFILRVDDPHIVDREDNVWLLTLNDFTDALLTEWCGLETIGRRINLEVLLLLAWITPPVVPKDYDFEIVLKTIDDVLGDPSETCHGDNVTTPEDLSFFTH